MPTLRRTDREPREVVITLAVHPGHLRGLPSHQGAAGLVAARGDPGDHLPPLVWVELAGSEIIQEEQRLGALNHDVVDTHRHQIDADRVMDSGLDRNFQLCADAIGAGHEDRIGKPRRFQVEQCAEAAEAAHHSWPIRGPRERLDRLHQRIGSLDVHAGGPVGQPVGGHCL